MWSVGLQRFRLVCVQYVSLCSQQIPRTTVVFKLLTHTRDRIRVVRPLVTVSLRQRPQTLPFSRLEPSTMRLNRVVDVPGLKQNVLVLLLRCYVTYSLATSHRVEPPRAVIIKYCSTAVEVFWL